MKTYKQTKMYPALEARIKTQEQRITNCGIDAMLGKYVLTDRGTYFSTKFKRQ